MRVISSLAAVAGGGTTDWGSPSSNICGEEKERCLEVSEFFSSKIGGCNCVGLKHFSTHHKVVVSESEGFLKLWDDGESADLTGS